MSEKKKVNVFEIEYETNDMNWKVKIAAWSKEDAFGYLSKMLGKTTYKIKGFTSISAIDAITTQVTDDIVRANTSGTVMSRNQKITPKTDTKQEEKEDSKSDDKDSSTTKKTTMKKK